MQKGRSWGDLPSFPCSHLFAAQTIFLPAYCQHPFSEKRNHTWNRPVPCHTARVTTGWRWRPPLEESALSRYPPLSDEPSTRCLHVRPTATHLSSGSLWPETCIHAVIGFFFFFLKTDFQNWHHQAWQLPLHKRWGNQVGSRVSSSTDIWEPGAEEKQRATL